MSISLLKAFAAAATLFLDPSGTHDYGLMTSAIANVVDREPALFADDPYKLKTASLVLAVGWREGSLRDKVQGDCADSAPGAACKGTPASFCTMQINVSNGGNESLNDDPEKCIATGLGMLRTSIKACPEHPVAVYARGGDGCTNERAQKVSKNRVTLAKRIYDVGLAAVRSIL